MAANDNIVEALDPRNLHSGIGFDVMEECSIRPKFLRPKYTSRMTRCRRTFVAAKTDVVVSHVFGLLRTSVFSPVYRACPAQRVFGPPFMAGNV